MVTSEWSFRLFVNLLSQKKGTPGHLQEMMNSLERNLIWIFMCLAGRRCHWSLLKCGWFPKQKEHTCLLINRMSIFLDMMLSHVDTELIKTHSTWSSGFIMVKIFIWHFDYICKIGLTFWFVFFRAFSRIVQDQRGIMLLCYKTPWQDASIYHTSI